jgi:type II secretion system protein E
MDIGTLLVRNGLLLPEQLAELRRQAETQPSRSLIELGIQAGLLDEREVLEMLAQVLGLPLEDLHDRQIPPEVLKLVPARVVYRYNILPLSQQNGVLRVATSDPFNVYALDEIEAQTGLKVEPVLARRSEIERLVKQHFGLGGETVTELIQERQQLEVLEEPEELEAELDEEAKQPSVVRLVNEILLEAIEQRASDVHIECQESGLKLRYRIDGVLHRQPVPPEIDRFRSAIISRLKIMARLNIAEKRLPQDGRIRLRVHGRDVDVRVSVIPMIHGEGLVLRILDKGGMEFDLRKLGMEQDTYRTFGELIQRPHGILLVTGPTGSGKTTTLYSALRDIRDESIKIITIEDPVEYHLEGLNQIQVHARIGLTFAAGLRSILRHDPDVILVGEIRDLETAEIAIQASLTGHLVFSTLHTNDAASAFVRLVDMGVEPYLVASTVEAVMAQRLVRVLCERCKAPYRPGPEDVPADFPYEPGRELFRAVGCRECRQTGFRGRMGIFELLVTDESIRELTVQRAAASVILRAARQKGMRTLREDGWIKVLQGQTTIEEVLRVAKA